MDFYYDETESDFDYVRKALSILSNTIFCIIFLSLLLIMPIAMAYVGVKNLMDCPKEPNIPIYLFVGGALGLVKLLQTLWEQWRKKRKERFDQEDIADVDGFEMPDVRNGGTGGLNNSSRFMDIIMSIFLLIWFCLGNYWVFKIWKPNFQQPRENGSQNWCSKDAYMVAVIHIFVCYVLAILFMILTCSLFIYSKFCRIIETAEPDPTTNPSVDT